MNTHLAIARGALTALTVGVLAVGSAAVWANDDGNGGKIVISTPLAPAAIGPYSQAIRVGKTVYLSGQVAIDPTTNKIEATTTGDQTTRVLQNLEGVLTAAGLTLNDVVNTTVYMVDVTKFSEMNAAYGNFFKSAPPARATIQVAALPKMGALVEISAIAVAAGGD